MPTRTQLNTNLTNILAPVVDIPDHLQANQMMLDYVDQQVASVQHTDAWTLEKSGYYTKAQVDVIFSGYSTTWNSLQGKPSVFAPAPHTHNMTDVTGLQTALDAKVSVPSNPQEGLVLKYIGGAIVWSDDITASGGSGGSAAWSDITGKPLTFAPSAHTHSIADVTSLQTSLDGKAPTVHTHAISDVSGLQTALNGKQVVGNYSVVGHSHQIADTTGLQAALDGKQPSGSYAPTVHTHAISDVTGLQTQLNAKISNPANPHDGMVLTYNSGNIIWNDAPTGGSDAPATLTSDTFSI